MAELGRVIFIAFATTICGRFAGAVSTLNDLDNQVANLLDQYFDKQSTIPLQNVAEVMNITVDFQLTSISNVDADEGYASISGYLLVTWVEERYTPVADDVWTLVPANKIWVPPLRLITSSVSSKVISDNDVANVHLQSNTVVWRPSTFANVGCTTNQYFPFDEVRCSLKVASNDYETSEMDILTNSTDVLTDEFVENSEWFLLSTSAQRKTSNGKAYVDFEVVVKRGSAFHASLILVPIISASFLHLFVFFVPQGTNQRLQFSVLCIVVVMLTFVSTQTSLPRSTSPVSIVLFYLMAELFVNILTTIIVVLLGTFGRKLESLSACISSLGGTSKSSRVRSMQADAATDKQTTNSRANKEGTDISGNVLTVWNDVDDDDERTHKQTTKDSNGNQHERIGKDNNATLTVIDVVIFVLFLCIHSILTVGFFVPLGIY